jgi:hypothetical protein
MPGWQFLEGRITLFALRETPKAADLFREAWGKEPDNFQSSSGPNIGPFGGAGSIASSIEGELTKTVSVVPGRIDINISPSASPDPGSTVRFLSSDSVVSALSFASGNLSLASLNRLGVYARLGSLASSDADANAMLCSAIDPKYRPPELTDETDFLLQVNRPTLTEYNEILNLITKYALERVNTITFGVQGVVAPVISERIVATISLDFNTRPRPGGYEKEQAKALLGDLLVHVEEQTLAYTKSET